MREILVSIVVLVALCSPVSAKPDKSPDIPTRFGSPTTCTTTGGTTLSVPAGWILVPPPYWAALDLEMKRLQVVEIKLTAENKSLKTSLMKRPIPWYYVAGAISLGFTAGYAWKAVR